MAFQEFRRHTGKMECCCSVRRGCSLRRGCFLLKDCLPQESSQKKVPAGGRTGLCWRTCASFCVSTGDDKGGTGEKIPRCAQVAKTGPELDRNRWEPLFVPGSSDQFRVYPFPYCALREMQAGVHSSRSPACIAKPLSSSPSHCQTGSLGRLTRAPSCATAS
jgi:hypothetical protein